MTDKAHLGFLLQKMAHREHQDKYYASDSESEYTIEDSEQDDDSLSEYEAEEDDSQ